MSIYDIKFRDTRSTNDIDLSNYKGKVIMVVNSASECGFTKQYKEMQEIWEKYRDQNFILIALPTNDFGNQEPGSNKKIKNFCEVNFGSNFIIAEKVVAKGENRHPFFKLVKEEFSFGAGPYWNFYKYIFTPTGEPVAWFSSLTKPNSPRLTSVIEKYLSNNKDEK